MADRITSLHHNTPSQLQVAEKPNQQRLVAHAASVSRRVISAENQSKLSKSKVAAKAEAQAVAKAPEVRLPEPPPIPEPVDVRPIILRRGLAVHLTAKDVFEMTTPHAPIKAALKGYQKNTTELSKSKLDVRA